ncbi:polysaccharide pyruvyl transferase family protein [Sphingomonas crocodyli]|uniref:Polysaccharide pyruvyl transferase domain-containing protein n=1 Tax=Sphingomonas crocodyli TaxID=1979270 RepID=A0A437LXY1_9SPHN|nr:polysaccharide pyruvyl transferase family protein [Sphingomonas crocodyli]RVT90186.1 hypothetical protein EOD43_17955 [Sphingomonas crocodyli]
MATVQRSVGEGFRDHDKRIEYFIKHDAVQNFGDYLPELFSKELFLHPRVDADIYRLVGSVIDEKWVRHDLGRFNGFVTGQIAFWCCGARGSAGLSNETKQHCLFFGVRGPETREALKLPADTVMGDPGLLAPLLHTPNYCYETAGKSVCFAHVHDAKAPEDVLGMSGADILLSPVIDSSEAALRSLLDKIASADFVLTASLHAAIIACAYGRPFAFWDNGHVDIPFKWRDFAGSVGIPSVFVKDLSEGREVYERQIKPRLKLPPFAPILDVCPFLVRPSYMLKALVADGQIDPTLAEPAIRLLERQKAYQHDEIYRLQDQSAIARAERARPSTYFLGGAGLFARRIKNKVRAALGL